MEKDPEKRKEKYNEIVKHTRYIINWCREHGADIPTTSGKTENPNKI